MIKADFGKYEAVIGLEVHAQLLTKTKLFSGDSATYGGSPNTHISPITLGYPGTLPKLNRHAVELAIKMGLACGCEIEGVNYFARKNYFYPDLPKGYQITQHTTPLCKNGGVKIEVEGISRKVKLNRIHLEEDAGKSLHDVDATHTSVDYNRAGVPLIEIVSEPDIFSGEEAYAYLTELRKLVRHLGICDGNMEEGSMRCDANVSVRLKGETKLGTRVEVKNLNSIRNVRKAIEYEIWRLIGIVESGSLVIQQTRSYDADKDSTFPLRSKEEANDYRYFPDPDLPPFVITPEMLAEIKRLMPALPEEMVDRLTRDFNLTEYDAKVICNDKELINYFLEITKTTKHYKSAANWLLGPVKSYLNEHGLAMEAFPVTPATLAALIDLVESGKVNFSVGSSRILPALIKNNDTDPLKLATEMNLLQDSDSSAIEVWVDEVLSNMPAKVEEYKKGKKGLIGLFIGEVKKISKGKADPVIATRLINEKLSGQTTK